MEHCRASDPALRYLYHAEHHQEEHSSAPAAVRLSSFLARCEASVLPSLKIQCPFHLELLGFDEAILTSVNESSYLDVALEQFQTSWSTHNFIHIVSVARTHD